VPLVIYSGSAGWLVTIPQRVRSVPVELSGLREVIDNDLSLPARLQMRLGKGRRHKAHVRVAEVRDDGEEVIRDAT